VLWDLSEFTCKNINETSKYIQRGGLHSGCTWYSAHCECMDAPLPEVSHREMAIAFVCFCVQENEQEGSESCFAAEAEAKELKTDD